jgi:hypothetical protein
LQILDYVNAGGTVVAFDGSNFAPFAPPSRSELLTALDLFCIQILQMHLKLPKKPHPKPALVDRFRVTYGHSNDESRFATHSILIS